MGWFKNTAYSGILAATLALGFASCRSNLEGITDPNPTDTIPNNNPLLTKLRPDSVLDRNDSLRLERHYVVCEVEDQDKAGIDVILYGAREGGEYSEITRGSIKPGEAKGIVAREITSEIEFDPYTYKILCAARSQDVEKEATGEFSVSPTNRYRPEVNIISRLNLREDPQTFQFDYEVRDRDLRFFNGATIPARRTLTFYGSDRNGTPKVLEDIEDALVVDESGTVRGSFSMPIPFEHVADPERDFNRITYFIAVNSQGDKAEDVGIVSFAVDAHPVTVEASIERVNRTVHTSCNITEGDDWNGFAFGPNNLKTPHYSADYGSPSFTLRDSVVVPIDSTAQIRAVCKAIYQGVVAEDQTLFLTVPKEEINPDRGNNEEN